MADLTVEDRKIGGTGAGEIGDCVAFVGNIMVDFDFDTMSGILKVPNEAFRARARRAMEANMTTVRREIGEEAAATWDQDKIARLLVTELKRLVGPLIPRQVDGKLDGKMEELAEMMMNDTWLYRNGKRGSGRSVTIRSGLQVCQEWMETPAGVFSLQFKLRDGKLEGVSISGESCQHLPKQVARFASSLEGVTADKLKKAVSKLIESL